jgi:hypothetical protein
MFDILKKEGMLVDDTRKPQLLQTPVHILKEFRNHPVVQVVTKILHDPNNEMPFP